MLPACNLRCRILHAAILTAATPASTILTLYCNCRIPEFYLSGYGSTVYKFCIF